MPSYISLIRRAASSRCFIVSDSSGGSISTVL
jgi:hypothetical protein